MEKNKNLKEVVIEVNGDKWQEALDKAFKKINATKTIDGFRKGKAPKSVYLKRFGIESLFFEASDYCVNEAYQQMLEENKDLQIVAQPILDIRSIDEKHVEYVFTLTLKPEVKLGEYKNLDIKKEKVKVSKEEVEDAINNMREEYKEVILKEGKIENGDIAVIDFEGFKDGVAFEGGKGENYSLEIGSNTFIPGFEEQLIGLSSGEEKDVNVTFPEDYHAEDLKGAPVVFKVTVHEVKQNKLPELDQDFFEDLGMEGIDSKEALEKQVKENIKTRKESEVSEKYTNDILDKVAESSEMDIPETMVDEETEHMVKHFAEHIAMQGINIEQFYQITNSTKEELKDKYKEEALKRIKYRLVLDAVIEKENITISDEEVDAKVEELSKKYNMTKEEVKKEYDNNLEYISYDLKVNKALEIMKGE